MERLSGYRNVTVPAVRSGSQEEALAGLTHGRPPLLVVRPTATWSQFTRGVHPSA
jgi:hypothetical protein